MRRLLRGSAALCVLVLISSTGIITGISAKDELSIQVVGDQQVAGKPFLVRIRNNGDKRLTFCLSVCGKILESGNTHPAPMFAVQMRVQKKWNKEVWACDPGGTSASSILHGGDMQEFTIKMSQPGTYRLWLAYKDVSVEGVESHCEAIKDGRAVQQAKTDEFSVIADHP
jgi:hypothetical protein